MTIKSLISQKEKQLLEASKMHDTDVLNRLLHDDLIFNFPSSRMITKKSKIDAYRSGDISLHKIVSSEEIITVMEDVAVVSLKIYLKGQYREDEFDGYFRSLRIWKEFENDWKVIAGSSVPIK